jgi:arylsulfatase A-like enzyme
MRWTDNVLREYVLPELKPDVVIDWLGPLDSAQHAYGVGSPEAKAALRQIDDSLAQTIATLESLGRLSRTDIIVTSDHGFAHHRERVDIVGRLIAAGLKAGPASTDLIVASQSESLLFYLPERQVEPLVRFLQNEPSVDAILTRGGTGGLGSVSGTFSFDLIGAAHPVRGANVIASLAWSGDPNAFGVEGAQTIAGSTTGSIPGNASGHGGLNPWVVRNTFVAWGADFQSPRRFDEPVSLADVTPTTLALFGISTPTEPGRGRVLDELVRRDGSTVRVSRRTIETRAGSFASTIVISSVAGHDYVDRASRSR